MKIVKCFYFIFIAINILINGVYTEGMKMNMVMNVKFLKNNMRKNTPPVNNAESQLNLAKKTDLPDVPIYHQGWVKYFRYQDQKGSTRPNTFFKNDEFKKQVNPANQTDQVNNVCNIVWFFKYTR